MPEKIDIDARNIEKMADIGRLTRGIVHDVNNSLASIMGNAEFLMSDLPHGSEQYFFAENIKKAGFQLQTLIDQIRAVAAEKNTTKDVRFNLIEEIETLSERFQSGLTSDQIISFLSDLESAQLVTPLYQFKTMIGNLIHNAIDSLHHKKGDISIRITAMSAKERRKTINSYDASTTLVHPFSEETESITIEIMDTGCGMDQDTLLLSSKPHFTTRIAEEAHGLGLTIAAEIASYLGGGLTIASTLMKGTHIILTIPVENMTFKTIETGTISPKSILVVDDKGSVLNTVSTMLRRENHKVISLSDADTALDMLREHPTDFDLLITGYTMPYISGKDLVEDIRQDFKKLPVIVMSGDMKCLDDLKNNPDISNILMLEKPVSAKKMRKAIQSMLT